MTAAVNTLLIVITSYSIHYTKLYDNKFGAFLDWGLEKDLFVPFKEQAKPMEVGKRYLIYVYLDEKTNRLAASYNFV